MNIPISSLAPPELASLPYKDLLEQKRTRDKIEPKVAEIARLVPADQYFLQLNSMQSLDELLDLSRNGAEVSCGSSPSRPRTSSCSGSWKSSSASAATC